MSLYRPPRSSEPRDVAEQRAFDLISLVVGAGDNGVAADRAIGVLVASTDPERVLVVASLVGTAAALVRQMAEDLDTDPHELLAALRGD